MARESRVIISGVRQVSEAFKELPRKIQNKIYRKGLTQAARIVREKARELVPVDSGELRASIKARNKKSSRRGMMRREVRAMAAYAAATEFGRKTGSGSITKKQPFLKPALLISQAAIKQAIADAVADGLKG